MAKQSWTVSLDGASHTIELDHGSLSGRRRIVVDGQTVVLVPRHLLDLGSAHSLSIGDHECWVTVTPQAFNATNRLAVDGRWIDNGEPISESLTNGLIPMARPWDVVGACLGAASFSSVCFLLALVFGPFRLIYRQPYDGIEEVAFWGGLILGIASLTAVGPLAIIADKSRNLNQASVALLLGGYVASAVLFILVGSVLVGVLPGAVALMVTVELTGPAATRDLALAIWRLGFQTLAAVTLVAPFLVIILLEGVFVYTGLAGLAFYPLWRRTRVD